VGLPLARLKDSDIPALGLLVLLWIAAALIIDPSGDFAVVDDWAYAQSVQALIEGRGFILSDWTATNLASQVFWGAGFATLFGYSMTVLRWSTLTLGLIGGLAVFRLFRLAGVTRNAALLGALATMFNPLYFFLAFSFMSDVPYAAMQLAAMWLIAEGALAQSTLRQGLGWLIGMAALFCRQIGLFIPIAYAVDAVFRRPWRWRRVLGALAAVAAFAAAQSAYTAWLTASDKLPLLFGRQISGLGASLAGPPGELVARAFAFFRIDFSILVFSRCR
jgi:hypothetical protein